MLFINQVRHTIFLAEAAFILALPVGPFVQAQSVSLSSGLSDPITQSTSTAGFNSTFDAETSNFSNSDLRTGVSDDTHSQLLGSVLSPLVNPYTSASVDVAPRTAVLTDAQSTIGNGDVYFGGRHSQNFSLSSTLGSATRQSALGTFGVASMQSAFTNNLSGKAAFSGQASTQAGSVLSFSGEGIPIPKTQSGIGLTQTLTSVNGSDVSGGFYATDPVLTGANSASEADLQLLGDMPSPSLQTAQYFNEAARPITQYQYDDGQTPAMRGASASPGPVLGAAPEYQPPSNGFPDSTKGLAGLPSEASNFATPFTPFYNLNSVPFAPVSEGTVYALTQRLNPNLHTMPTARVNESFESFERHAQEQRLTHGFSISQAANVRQQDLRDYEHRNQHRRRSTLDRQNSQNSQNSRQELMAVPNIR